MALTKDPSKLSERFAALYHRWELVDALYGGTETMRLQAQRYLPRDTLEDQKQWETRLERTFLFNMYKRSIQQAIARLFQVDIELEGYPTQINIWAQDADAQGRDITQFTKEVVAEAINKGVAYVLVEHPKEEVSDRPYTAADILNKTSRPYWVFINPTQVLAAYSKLMGGVERLHHFRFKETVLEVSEDGLEEKNVEQIRVFSQPSAEEPVTVTVYRKETKGWQVVDEFVLIGMPFIPIVAFITKRTGFMLGEPPMYDFAEMQLCHWQSTSEQRHILHFARVPFLHINGMETTRTYTDELTGEQRTEEVPLNVHTALITDSERASAKWVETTGAGITAGANDLKDLESKMDRLGLTLTSPRSGNITATENSINAAEANSMLKDIGRTTADSLEVLLYYTSFYLGEQLAAESPARVNLDTTYAVDLQETSENEPSLT